MQASPVVEGWLLLGSWNKPSWSRNAMGIVGHAHFLIFSPAANFAVYKLRLLPPAENYYYIQIFNCIYCLFGRLY